jgi:membrane protease YdiL (CAAX protease family)
VNPYAAPKTDAGDAESDDELDRADRILHRRVLWARRVVIALALLSLFFIARDPWGVATSSVFLVAAYVVSLRHSPLLGLLVGFATLVPRWVSNLGILLGRWEEALFSWTSEQSVMFVASSLPTAFGLAVSFAMALVVWRGISAAAKLYGREERSWALIRPGLLAPLGLASLYAVEVYSSGWLSRYAVALEFAWVAACVPLVWRARGEWLGLLRRARLKNKDLLFVSGCVLALCAFTSELHWFAGKAEVVLPNRAGWFLEWGLPPALVLVLLAGWVPLVEELVFRGFLQSRFERVMSPRHALIAQAMLFSAAQGFEDTILWYAVIGVTLGWLRHRSRNLYAPLLLHVIYAAWVTLSGLGYLSGPLALELG